MLATLDPDFLSRIPLFEELTHDQLLALSNYLRSKTLPAETHFIMAEDRGGAVYIILSGSVKVYIQQEEEGKEVILAILGPGQTVGEMSLAGRLDRSATVVTLEETAFLQIDRDKFQEYLQTFPAMTYNLLKILSSRLRLANEQIRSLATLNVTGRIARQILAFANEYRKANGKGRTVIPLRLKQDDLANMVGASRVRVNQILVEFERSKYISHDVSHHIVVRRWTALKRKCK